MTTPGTAPDRRARLAEARAIITDPALCAARPMLRRLAWAALKCASGHPVLQAMPRAESPRSHGEWGRDGRTHWGTTEGRPS